MIRKALYNNFRLIYRISRWLRDRFTPGGLLVLGGAVASGLFGVNTRQTLAYQIFAICASLILLSIATSLRFRIPFRTERRLPRYGTVGQPLHYRLLITNASRTLQADVCVIDELDAPFPGFREFLRAKDPEDRHRNWFDRIVGYPRLMALVQKKRGATTTPVPMAEVPAGEEVPVDMEIQPQRRGFLRFSRTRLARPDPFGLFRAMQNHPGAASLLVLPRMYRVPALQLGGRRRYQRGGMNLASSVGDSQEFLSLREYKPGDPLRAIHWRSFAKIGKPVVKEFHDEFFVRQGLVLDTFIEDRSDELFEGAVSIAASFAMKVPDQDSLLDLMFIGTEAYRFTAGRGLGQIDNLLEILACVQACRDRSFQDLRELVRRHRDETSALICVFLGWDEQRRDFVRSFRSAGTPIAALVMAEDTDAIPEADKAFAPVFLPLGRIQESLDRAFPGPGGSQ